MNPRNIEKRMLIDELHEALEDKRKLIQSKELGLVVLKQEYNAQLDEYKKAVRR